MDIFDKIKIGLEEAIAYEQGAMLKDGSFHKILTEDIADGD